MKTQLKEDLVELFDILDTVETKESGDFRPTQIHTARLEHQRRLEIILPRLREFILIEDRADQECLDAFCVGLSN